jgi:colicin import membrane protein
MAEETDGVREAFDDALRIALTVATQLGEKVARLREQFGRQREARAVQTNRELEARFEAERGAMRASLLPLQQHDWWDGASVTDIANARETATAWSDFDDVARETNDTIEREVHERFGVEVSQSEANPAEVAEALRTAESERVAATTKRERQGEELTAAELLLLAANRRDRESAQAKSDEWAANPDYDSVARRDEFAASLVGVAEPATIAARILADGENARHPSEAITARSGQAAKVRRSTGPREQERQRSRIPGR